ncbi:MAG TPA: tRNA 2-thiocytidine biosynthesis protein TtcA [Firmicutes bacterium]|nr:tRNA 2-thiocytidine biosynthesis protein TtcA [Bacillota bacterium]
MKYPVKLFYRRVGQAMWDYRMISSGDHVAVGVSGGKDSLALVYALAHFRDVSPQKFRISAITVDSGWGQDFSKVKEFCQGLGIDYQVVPTLIGPVVFCLRKESNPCSLCALLRRGALNNAAKSLGANKVALAHHLDDAVETLLMSMFYEGRMAAFAPVTYLTRTGLHVIRPMVYVPEHLTQQLARIIPLPVIPTLCPAAGRTARAAVKRAISPLRSDKETDQTLKKAMVKFWRLQTSCSEEPSEE